jgi:3-oxoacyl-(acyl-carrier-protein) synthase
MTETHKEASGLSAIVAAVDLLREGRASAILAGGVDAVYETFFKGHDRYAVMSAAADFSSRLSPFDAQRSGFVMGEGGFGLWLTGEERAAHRGEILGVGASSAAVAVNAWPTRPEPLIRTMQAAIDDAGLRARDIDVVYASANATAALDAAEAAALRTLFADAAPVVTSIKGALGEFGAAGGAACVAALLCGAVGEVPPIAGLAEPDAAAAPLRLARTRTPAPGPIALVNSFASGGALFSVVLRAPAPAAA